MDDLSNSILTAYSAILKNSSFPSFNMKSSCLRVYEMRAGSPVNYETSRYCIKLYNSCIFLFSSLSYLLYI